MNSTTFKSLIQSYEEAVHLQVQNEDQSDKSEASEASEGVFAEVKQNAVEPPEDNSDKSSSELEITVEVKTSDEPTYSTQSTLEAKEKIIFEAPKVGETVASTVLEAEEPEAPPGDEISDTSDSEIIVQGPRLLR